MITISVDSMCAGLGHWNVSVTDGTTTIQLMVDWADMQSALSEEELRQITLLLLRARYAGIPIHSLGDLLLTGVTI